MSNIKDKNKEYKRRQRERDAAFPERKRFKPNMFMFGEHEIMIFLDNNNEIWFKGVDVAKALNIKEPKNSIRNNLDEKNIRKYKELSNVRRGLSNHPLNMHPDTMFMNESGLYTFLLRSRMPAAGPFVKWVTEEILPSIRKNNKYEIANENNPLTGIQEKLDEAYEIIKLKDEQLRTKDEQLRSKDSEMKVKDDRIGLVLERLLDVQPKVVPPTKDKKKAELFVLIAKQAHIITPDVEDRTSYDAPFYVMRVQESHYDNSLHELKCKYPHLRVL
jgi:prophage antirepressor-like protein